ncbi:MAG: hypothetical protein DWP94_12810 [Flavobacterium sp.]|nr:MAG: hypothetical protein DWP94_12810 [Flavobacterium sp.]
MKKLMNLTRAHKLSKNEQNQVLGGHPPVCGGTGGTKTNLTEAQCNGYGYSWEYNACYICY